MREITISGHTGKTIKELRSLVGNRGIRRHHKALVSGSKVIHELIALRPELVSGMVIPAQSQIELPDLPDFAVLYRIDRDLFRELDMFGTSQPLLVVNTPEISPYTPDDTSTMVLLIPFQDPANVGAVIRSAAAFGVERAVLLREAANPWHPKSIRAAGPHAFTLPLSSGPSIADLGAIGRPLVTLAAGGDDIGTVTFPLKFALLPGIEGPGLPTGIAADQAVSIPMAPHVESLNATVAVSIALYEYSRLVR